LPSARRAYACLGIGVMAFAVYASLIPFNLQYVPFDLAWTIYRAVMSHTSLRGISRTNFLANILLFVPVGFGLTGALLVDRRRRASLLAIVFVLLPSVALSLTVEFLQIFAPGRVPALSDVEGQTIGCLFGIGAWAIFGPELTDWLRESRHPAREDRLARALVAYAVVWIFVNLAPFDVTADVGDIGERVRAGLITIVPFTRANRPVSRVVWDVLVSVVSAAPLGVLGLVAWTPRGVRRRTLVACAIGAALVISIEVAQIFVNSHAADITDVIFGCLGVALGVSIGSRVLSSTRPVIDVPGASLFRGRAVGILAAWCLVIAAYHWMPYDFVLDTQAIKRKLGRISLVPFAGYAVGSDLNAFNDLLLKLGLAAPLGVIASYALRRKLPARFVIAGWLTAAAVLFGTIETGQLFLPTRSPDPTDVMIGVAGTALGFALGRWLQSGR
jgi:glycopeptide antibiotics resistance protein